MQWDLFTYLYFCDIFTKILGLDTCADTLVGDEMCKGISGGQMKRLTTGILQFIPEIFSGLPFLYT